MGTFLLIFTIQSRDVKLADRWFWLWHEEKKAKKLGAWMWKGDGGSAVVTREEISCVLKGSWLPNEPERPV